jgi:iron(III) transport system permease protein
LFSWIVVRTNTPFKGFIAAASILPLFAPPLVAGVAWAILGSPKTGLINTMFKWIGLDWRVDLQGCELMTARSIFPVVRPAL